MSAHRKITTVISALAAAALAATLAVQPAMASAPAGVQGGHIVGPKPVHYDPIDFPAGGTCAFPVHQAPVVNHVMVIQYYDDSGRLTKELYYGQLIDDVTNVSTGKTVRVDLSGSAVVTYGADGSSVIYGVGPYSAGMHPGDTPGPFLARIDGISELTIAASGVKRIVYATRVDNLCTAVS